MLTRKEICEGGWGEHFLVLRPAPKSGANAVIQQLTGLQLLWWRMAKHYIAPIGGDSGLRLNLTNHYAWLVESDDF
jgi:hypothetical protein